MFEGAALHPESDTRFFTENGATYTFILHSVDAVMALRFDVLV